MTEKQKALFGTRLKELRLLTGLSQFELAKEFYLSRSCWSNYECGKREPNIGLINKIAQYFKVDVRYLIDDGSLNNDTEDFIKQKISVEKYLTKDGKLNLDSLTTVNKIEIIDYYKYLKGKGNSNKDSTND